jgi:hypothetical protein
MFEMTIRSCNLVAAVALVGLAVLAAAPPAAAQTSVPVDTPSWVELAPKNAFDPLQPGIRRPGILLETDQYVYGTANLPDDPTLVVNLRSRGYTEPATLYLYWENRDTEQKMYYSVADGFVAQERDLFGTAGAPTKVFVPDLTDFRLFGTDSAFGPVPGAVSSNVGLYQFVLEIRNADGTEVVSRGNAMYNQVASVVNVNGDITGNTTWTSNNVYRLRGAPNFVTAGSRLTIEPGTVILGSRADQGTLVVLPGGQIFAQGDAMRPIIFTSELPVGERGPGDWGGLVISGNAPVSSSPRQGEGDSGEYGGDNPNDNSGVLSYVRVEFAGIRFNEVNELNGIALQGVGRNTQIDHIQVHHNSDDGIEFFGGTAEAKYVLITDARDDSLDWTFGWDGKLQHFVAIQRNQENDHGIEADNDEDDEDNTPRSNPTIYNATFVGNRNIQGSSAENGWLLRRGTYATIRNFIVTLFDNAAVEVDSTPSLNALGNQTRISHGFFFNNGGLGTPAAVMTYLQGETNVTQADPMLPYPNDAIQPDVAPLAGSPARSGHANPPNDGFFDSVSWRGGVDPNDPWIYEGWTTFSDN